jgi:flavorubredoxin
MATRHKAQEIAKGIFWVGGIDWNLRNFHGYLTPRGSTYNAYLVIDEKVTLIDTVKHYCYEEMIERISSVIDPSKIEVVISNHVEMDHSGGLPQLMQLIPQTTVVASVAGEKGLREHYHQDWRFKVVKTGDTLSLGRRSLQFVLTPMIHWPDNMIGYMPEEKILFSNDSFGQHYASSERFDDQMPLGIVLEEAKKYYGNIVLSYNAMVSKALDVVENLPLSIIAPSHGLIWRTHISQILKNYRQWSSNQTEQKALVIYDSMWGSTASMAQAIASGMESKGILTKLFDLKASHISDVMTDVVDSQYICVGSPTLNNNLLPTVAAFLVYLKALSPKSRVGLAFGSYGWGGQSIDQVHIGLKECGFEMWEPICLKYVPQKGDLDNIQKKVEAQLDLKAV